MGVPHLCDDRCVCPVHETKLLYSSHDGDHACADPNCEFAHGMDDKIAKWLDQRMGQTQRGLALLRAAWENDLWKAGAS